MHNTTIVAEESTTDARGNGTHVTYDIGGRRTRAMTSAGSTQQYEYDAAGNITGVMDGEAHRTRYEWGRIVEIRRPDGGSEYYRYDYVGNITSTVDGEGNTPRYECGANGQLLRMVKEFVIAGGNPMPSGSYSFRMDDYGNVERLKEW